MASPKTTLARPPRHGSTNGILPLPVAAVQSTRSKEGKTPGPRLKIVIRRLPPGLTKDEFVSCLGDDWLLNGGWVDWMIFKPGKISTDPAKLSRPARAYLHLTDPSHLPILADKIKSTQFIDSKNSWNTVSLFGPPSLEYAPCGRVPNHRVRTDARQGLIDQDAEFIGFLQSLTDPVTTKLSIDADGTTKKEEKVTITPLVQYLKDKKASKGKDGAGGRGSRHSRAESKDKSGDKHIANKASNQILASPDIKRRSKDGRADKVAKDAVKVLHREAGRLSGSKGTTAGTEVITSPQTKNQNPPTGPAADRRRERGNAAAAARILQRDLGLASGGGSGGGGRRRGGTRGTNESANGRRSSPSSSPLKQNAVLAGPLPKTPESSASLLPPPEVNDVVYPPEDELFVGVGDLGEKEFEAQGPAAETAARDAAERSHKAVPPIKPGPVPQMILKKPPSGPAAERTAGSGRAASTENRGAGPSANHPPKADKPAIVPNQAFLKHANPSQGITEPLIQTALEAHGSVSKVEIDTKKGFAYVNFDTREGLLAAIKASPVKVAQGQVQVLERVEKKGHAFRKDLGGGTQGGRAKAAKGIFKQKGNRGGGGGNRGGATGNNAAGAASTTTKASVPPAGTG